MMGRVEEQIESVNLISIVHALTVIAGCLIYQQQSPDALWHFYGFVVVAVVVMDIWVGGPILLRKVE